MPSALWVVLLVLACGLRETRADIYSWTDEEGVQHFTNTKPKGGGKWKKVLTSEPEKGSKAAAERGSCPRCDKVTSNDRSPERFHRYDAFIFEAADLYRIPVPLIRAVIKVESDYDPRVVSAMDCKGLMQVHPAVEVDMGVQGDVFDPRTNIMAGTRLLRWLANRVDDRRLPRGPRLAREVRLHGAAVHAHAEVPEDGARPLLPLQDRGSAAASPLRCFDSR